jgi:UDP-N-acetylglucosamine--N-acetylmuramyl-(pentapeptide) pyrophosphoryl-undecaprenol N-acetylglucosamine transferase
MASFFGGGAISALFYARRLVDLPLVLFGKAFSGFPAAKAISDFKAGTPGTSLGKIVILASQSVIVPLLPLTVFCLLYAQEIVQLVFMRGAFDAEDVKAVSLPFTFFALGLIPMALRQTLGEIISATEDNAPLVWVSIPGALLNVIMNIVLVQTPLSYGGIALATTLSYLFQVVLLFRWINRKVERLQGKPLRPLFWRTILGLGLFFLLVWGLKSSITLPHQGWLRLISLMLIGTLSFGFYFLILLPFFIERKRPELKIVLAGGGTGGHVYPGLAILEAIQSSELLLGDIHYLGMKGKPEEAIVGKAGLPFLKIRSAPIAGLHPKTLIKAIWTIGLGTLQSMRHFIRLRPNLIVAGGGYVSAPAVFAGFLLRPYLKCRILVAEQNFMPGLLNKAASLLADAVLVNFKPSAFFLWSNNCVHVGYPVRQALLQNTETPQALRHRLGLSGDRQVLVVYGGSIGAKTINESLLNALPSLLNRHPRLSVIHSFGLNQSQAYHAKNQCLRHLRELFPQENQDEVNDHFVIRDEQGQLRYLGQPFFHDLYDYLKVADVVVSRAGAGALAEIQALGKAALVIPKRGLPGDHQELNAIDLASRGICDVLFEEQPPGNEWPDIPQEELLIRLEALMADDQKRQSYEEKAKASFFESFQRTTIQAVRDVLEQRRLDLISTISEPLLARLHRQEDFLVSHLKTLPKGHLLRRYYSGKIPHLLKSTHYLGVNKGIKLIGALNARTYLDWLFEHFSDFNGFQKRNTLIALNHMDFFDGRVERLIQRALKDRYFETRREAVCLAARHLNRLAQPEIIQQLILERIRDSSESFEVRVEGLKTCVFFLSQREFMEVGQPFLTHRQVRLREGLILALEHALRQNRFDDLKSLRKFAQQVMITTSDYEPVFRIRNHFKSLSQRLEEKR